MQVLSLGMLRTGTMSMQAGLQLPGYDVLHHGTHLIDNSKTNNADTTLIV